MAYFECLHEVKLIVDLIYEGGIANMNYSISNTAEYGEYVTGPRIITPETKAEMKRVLDRHPVGQVHPRLDAGEQGQPDLVQGDPRQNNAHQIEEVGEKLRAMMPWIGKNKLVDKTQELSAGGAASGALDTPPRLCYMPGRALAGLNLGPAAAISMGA